MQYGTPGWLELYDLSFHQQSEAVSPKGLNIKGDLEKENNFIPSSEIEGKPFADAPLHDKGQVYVWFTWIVLKNIAKATLDPWVTNEVNSQYFW